MPGLTYALGRGVVELAADGTIEAVRPRSDAASFLAGGGRLRVWSGGTALVWSAPEASVDDDELELGHTSAAGVGLVLRHSFAAGWTIRVVFVNHTPEPVMLTAELAWEPAAECAAWALAAGATGAYAIPGPAGRGRLLGGELVLGTCDRVSDGSIGLGRVRLGPQERYVVQWRWDWYASPRAFSRRRSGAVPRDLVLSENETACIAADDDQAVVAPGLDLVRRSGHLEFSSPGGHRVAMEVRSARGVTAYEVQWVEPLGEVLAALGEQLLTGPRSRTGVARLPNVDAALVLQHLLGCGRVDDPDDADDALGLLVSRGSPPGSADARWTALLAGEYERTGDPDLLDRATADLLAFAVPVPGLGLAAAQVCVSRLTRGWPVDSVLDQLTRLAVSEGGDLGSLAITLELRLTSARRATRDAGDRSVVEEGVRQLGAALGAGLPGRPVRPLPIDQQAYLAVVLGLLPEDLGARYRPEWGLRPTEVARTAGAEVVARLGRQPPGAAHSWLIMGSRLA